jgi:hypothetical protein
MAKQKRISTLMKDAESAGLPDDIDVTIVGSKYACRSSADYKADAEVDAQDAVPVWVLTLQPEDGEPFDLIESCGNIRRVVPGDDGTFLAQAEGSSAAGMSNSCKAYHLLASMIECDESVDAKANEDISSLEGMKWHLLRKPAPKSWAGLAEPEADSNGRKARPRTIETCTEIHSLPWKGGKKASSAPAKGRKGKAEPEPADEADDASTEAEGIVDGIVREKGKVKAASLYKLAQGAAKKSDNKDAIIELLQDDGWLGADDRPWLFEDGVLSSPE